MVLLRAPASIFGGKHGGVVGRAERALNIIFHSREPSLRAHSDYLYTAPSSTVADRIISKLKITLLDGRG